MGEEPIEEGGERSRVVTRPRPGHADLNGAMKYGHRDMRNVLERSSATRNDDPRRSRRCCEKTVASMLDIEVAGHVQVIAGIKAKEIEHLTIEELMKIRNSLRCAYWTKKPKNR